MPASRDSVVEIPPPADPSLATGAYAVPIAVATVLVGLAALISTTRPSEPAVEWLPTHGPPGSMNLDSLVAYDDGFVVLSGVTGEGISIWWEQGGGRWRSQVLDRSPSQLATLAGRLIAHDSLDGSLLALQEDGWGTVGVMEFPDDVRSRRRSGRSALVGFGDGVVLMSLYGDVWWSPDLESFQRVISDPALGHGTEQPFASDCRPPSRSSPDVPPMVATDSGLVAWTSANPDEPFGIWPVCEPTAWLSGDAATWTSSATSIGDGGYFYDVAWREGLFVAVGGYGIGESVAWRSGDGLDWQPIDELSLGRDQELYKVRSGPAGWIVLGRDQSEGAWVGWTSRDGVCWEPLPEGVEGGDGVVSSHRILVVDRAEYPAAWVGRLGGGEGRCL